MSSAHIPKPPSAEDLEYFNTLTIDCDSGRVWNADGYEYKNVGELHQRVQVPGKCRNYAQRTFKRYHLVYWAFHGYWPDTLIDHWDGIPHHDWISNLRPATSQENAFTGVQATKYPLGKLSNDEILKMVKERLHD